MITEKTTTEAQDVKQLLLRTYKKYKSGLITEAQATKEAQLLNSLLRAIEVTELEERITQLENKI